MTTKDNAELDELDQFIESLNSDNPSRLPRRGKIGRPVTKGVGSKRIEQNRRAQRAFRERKEKYVLDLEKRVKELEGLLNSESTKDLFEENKALKEQYANCQAENGYLKAITGQNLVDMRRASTASQESQSQFLTTPSPQSSHIPSLGNFISNQPLLLSPTASDTANSESTSARSSQSDMFYLPTFFEI